MVKKDKLTAVRIAATIVGTVIGAGFASGQEIQHFFISRGGGFAGVCLATVLFCAFGAGFLWMSRRIRAASYAEVLRHLAGPWVGGIMDALMTAFLLGITGVMLAGAGAAFESLGWPAVWGIALTLAVSLAAVLNGVEGVMTVNVFVVPLMLAFSVGLGVWAVVFGQSAPAAGPQGVTAAGLFASVIYVSYNISMALPVIAPLGGVAPERRAVTGGLAAGLMLGAMVLAVFLAIQAGSASLHEVPMLDVAGKLGRPVQLFYGVVLWGEIMTTMVGNLFGLARRISGRSRLPYPAAVLIATGLALIISRAGFARLVQVLYPVFGYICLIILALLAAWVARKWAASVFCQSKSAVMEKHRLSPSRRKPQRVV